MGDKSAAEQFASAATDSRKFLRSDLVEELGVGEMTTEALETRIELVVSSLFDFRSFVWAILLTNP